MEQYQSYTDILKMDSLVFISYIEQFKKDVDTNVSNAGQLYVAGNELGKISNRYSFLSSLLSNAKVMKRGLNRTGKITEYEDMIDKESAIEVALKAVDMQYKALSKAINVHIENNKELFYTDGV